MRFLATALALADPSGIAASGTAPPGSLTITVDHPIGVEASTMARYLRGGGVVLPRTTESDQAIKGDVLSVNHNGGVDVVVLTTHGSPDHLTARVAADPRLRTGIEVGIACRRQDATATTAEVSDCRLVSAPGTPPATITFTGAR